MSRKVTSFVDWGLSGGSRVHRPGSEDPHRHERKFESKMGEWDQNEQPEESKNRAELDPEQHLGLDQADQDVMISPEMTLKAFYIEKTGARECIMNGYNGDLCREMGEDGSIIRAEPKLSDNDELGQAKQMGGAQVEESKIA